MPKILIVEDDVFLSKMYSKKFQVAGYQVQIARDGIDALNKVKESKPDLVLMDILMPKLNGLEVLDKLKSDPETKSIPIVMATNLSTTDDAETALRKGAAKYIVKSEVTPSELVKIISSLIKH